MAAPKKGPTKAQINAAKKTLRQAGFSLASMAKATGTTKNEVRKAMNTSARRLAAGESTPLRQVRKASYGGKMAGVPSSAKRTANVNARAASARKAYGWKPPKTTRKTS